MMKQKPKWKASYRFYKGCFRIARAIFFIGGYRFDVKGKEHIPVGAAMICSNHSNLLDPLFIAVACGAEHFIHFIAKSELFKIPVLTAVIMKLGAISVERGTADVTMVKNTLAYLKNGEKVAIFPEGTRASENDSVAAKSGAVKLAERANAPLLPVFIPKKKPLFSKLQIVIGEPYYIEKPAEKYHAEDYTALAAELMKRIESLSPASVSVS